MSLGEYLKGKRSDILVNIIGLITLIIFLFSVGNTFDAIVTVLITWITVVVLFFICEYRQRKLYFKELEESIDKLDKKYLISGVIDYPRYIDSVPYYIMMKKASKSMIEEITRVKNQRKDYKEYIEKWIHEVKTPIAAIKIIEENNKSNVSRVVLLELGKIDEFVEQTLFYARSEEVEKDYLIKEISLEQCVNEVIIKNKQLFISNNINIELYELDKNIYSDSKWVEFIVNQVVINSIKYRVKDHSEVRIYTLDIKNGIQLIIEDNGIGIDDSEINRVFEKGFTGNNGRLNQKSTGIGLYLCKKLCDKLGIGIAIESHKNIYTKVIITFPKGSFCRVGG